MLGDQSKNNKRKTPKTIVCKIVIVSIIVCIAVHILFKIEAPFHWLVAEWTAGEILTFIASVFIFIGTYLLGVRTSETANKYQEIANKLSEDNNRLQKILAQNSLPIFAVNDAKVTQTMDCDRIEPSILNKTQSFTIAGVHSSENNGWAMLISNSVKVSHPFNADFLHNLLSRYELNKRDYLWTIYINKLTWNESDRIVQLVQLYNSGEKLEFSSEKQVELLLTLLGWLLTSSNRWLRDYTSKAMIEILKDHFGLCKKILEKFESVNDPYVNQRLYGVVFGACCKRTNGELQELAEYVYEAIFNREKVYPDILLRDYQ